MTARLFQRIRQALDDDLAAKQLRDLLDNLAGTSTAAPWVALTPASGWAVSGIYGDPEYRVVGDVVELRGGVTSPSGEQGLASTLFTMPAGTRPAALATFPAAYLAGGPLAAEGGQISVAAAGDATLLNNAGAATSAKHVTLAGLSWALSA